MEVNEMAASEPESRLATAARLTKANTLGPEWLWTTHGCTPWSYCPYHQGFYDGMLTNDMIATAEVHRLRQGLDWIRHGMQQDENHDEATTYALIDRLLRPQDG